MMSTFTSSLKVEFVDGLYWELLEDFVYYLEDDNDQIITVPKGYRTDFSSIPTVFWSALRHKDIFNKASVVHDYLCDTNGDHGRFNKKQVHQIYLDGLKVLSINRVKSKIFWSMVTLFADIDYTDYTKKGE